MRLSRAASRKATRHGTVVRLTTARSRRRRTCGLASVAATTQASDPAGLVLGRVWGGLRPRPLHGSGCGRRLSRRRRQGRNEALRTLGALRALEALEALRALRTLGTLRTLEALRALRTLRTLEALWALRTLRTLKTLRTLTTLDALGAWPARRTLE